MHVKQIYVHHAYNLIPYFVLLVLMVLLQLIMI